MKNVPVTIRLSAIGSEKEAFGVKWRKSPRARHGRAAAWLVLLILAAACPLRAQNDAAWADFQQKAAAWRALPTKPAMSEEVRAARVQAENAFKEKRLRDAAAHYEEGIKIDPVWPEGYFNAALIYAELGDYDKAIWHMRAYVELVPDAPDARSARDQIAIWVDKSKLLETVVYLDPATKLMWTRQGVDYSDSNQASNYCRNSSLGGYSGWRLPTGDELKTLHDKTQNVSGNHIRGGINLCPGGWVWFSTSGGYAIDVFGSTWNKQHLQALCVRNSGG